MAGAGYKSVENDAVVLLSFTAVNNKEPTEEVNACFCERKR